MLVHRSRDDPDYDESGSSAFVLLNPESREVRFFVETQILLEFYNW